MALFTSLSEYCRGKKYIHVAVPMHIVNSILQDLIYEEDSRKNNNAFSLSFVTEKVHRKIYDKSSYTFTSFICYPCL